MKVGDIVMYYPVAIEKCSEEKWIEEEKFYGVVIATENPGWSHVSYRRSVFGSVRYCKQEFPNASLIVLANVSDFGLEMP